MPGPRFIAFAQRIHAYDGAVTALIRAELAEQNAAPAAAPQAAPRAAPVSRPAAAGRDVTVIGASRAELMMSEELGGLISFGTG